MNQPYNDIGFQVGEKLMIFVECQVSWTENIVVRILMYLVQTYKEYIKSTKQDIYGRKKVCFPEAELYVIYIGERKGKLPRYLYLSKEFFGGRKCAVEVKVKMIYNGKKGIL